MWRRMTWILFFAGLLVLCGCKPRSSQIAYQGRSFEQWYHHWANAADRGDKAQEKEGREAIRQMGTNLLPFLLTQLRSQAEHDANPDIPPTIVFRVLGPVAGPAVPELEKMMQETNATLIVLASRSLGAIGEEAVPSLMRLLSHARRDTRYHAIYEFGSQLEYGEVYTNRQVLSNAIPALAGCMKDPEPYVTIHAIRALAVINLRPELAVPALREALASTNSTVRQEAGEAMGKFGIR